MTYNPFKWVLGFHYQITLMLLNEEYKATAQTFPEGKEKESVLSDINDICKEYEEKYKRIMH